MTEGNSGTGNTLTYTVKRVGDLSQAGSVAFDLEANDEWQTQNRYMQTEPMAELMAASTKPETVRLSTTAA